MSQQHKKQIEKAIRQTKAECKEKFKEMIEILDLDKILREHKEVVEDYIYGRVAKAHYPKSIEEHLRFIRDKIIDFGYGETEFHTADVELLLQIAMKSKELLQKADEMFNEEEKK